MKISTFGILAGLGLVATIVAEDLLFLDTLHGEEYSEAQSPDGFTVKSVSATQWSAMTTIDFAAFKAIIFADEFGGADAATLQLIEDTKTVWSPAVTGNMIIIGSDPSNHFSTGGAKVLIDNAIKFAAAKVDSTGKSQTGLYFALSHFYDTVDNSTVTSLSYFGDFEVRGNLNCYNNAHLVASSPAIATLTDADLSNWSCSVHEAFSSYPTTGVNGFQALAIATIVGPGSQTFGDKSVGLPYIISRGATPAGCGDGHWDPQLGEECDDGNLINGDGCSSSCKCESGLPKGDGTCFPRPSISGTAPVSSKASTSVLYGNSTTAYVPTSTTPPTQIIIGVEIIIEIIIIENCQTINPTSTITEYVTSTCSTMQRPIFATSTLGYPCYPCAMASQGITCPAGAFMTATTTICPSCPAGILPTPVLPVVQPCSSCKPITLLSAPILTTTATAYIIPMPSMPPVGQEHGLTTTPPAYTTFATGTVKASATGAVFTGAAQANAVPGVAGGLLVLMAMLL